MQLLWSYIDNTGRFEKSHKNNEVISEIFSINLSSSFETGHSKSIAIISCLATISVPNQVGAT